MNVNEHRDKTKKRLKTRDILPTIKCRGTPMTMRIEENVEYASLHLNSDIGNQETDVPFERE